MEKPRSAPIRHDFWDHPKTSWMYPDDFAVFAVCASASILGVCTYSEKKIAKLTKVHADKVALVLHALEQHGNARWWPDDEIVWIVERADEARVAGKSWYSAQREWRTYPEHVRDAIAARYPVLAGKIGRGTMFTGGLIPEDAAGLIGDKANSGIGYAHTHDDTISPTQGSGSVSSSVSGSRSSSSSGQGVDPVAAKQAAEDAEVAVVAAALRPDGGNIRPAGMPCMLCPDDGVRKLLRRGASSAEIVDTLRRFAADIEAGLEKREFWKSTYFFSGFYDRLRQPSEPARKDKEL